MKCEVCRGACCETIVLHVTVPTVDMANYVQLHSVPVEGSPFVKDRVFECKCTALSSAGRCNVYQARPQVCRDYRAGGVECLRTVVSRRTKKEFALIREAGDPTWKDVDRRIRELKNTAVVLDF